VAEDVEPEFKPQYHKKKKKEKSTNDIKQSKIISNPNPSGNSFYGKVNISIHNRKRLLNKLS
jgi:hypothetical protein